METAMDAERAARREEARQEYERAMSQEVRRMALRAALGGRYSLESVHVELAMDAQRARVAMGCEP